MPLKRFCGDFRPLLRDFPLTHPFFAHLTHLGLMQVTILTAPAAAALCDRLVRILPLTHLAFDHPNIIPECLALLQNCKSVRVLVFFGLGLGEQEWSQKYLAPLSHDPRFLAMEEAWYVEDWHIGVREGLDFGLVLKTLLRVVGRGRLIFRSMKFSMHRLKKRRRMNAQGGRSACSTECGIESGLEIFDPAFSRFLEISAGTQCKYRSRKE
ncbi:hypothetical protein C8F04DRAFT_1199106 [Mycena alexandri]|uniref:Uncharacterized protein n=1 Tax=Mycena alexandri TaxID=1745969 RepID=A0AAD6WMN9_9AGAR|nr:hypothetical protein C8F04DRAFT_1199106 [Mycena alexandri]